MIVIDSDLDSDSEAEPPASNSKRVRSVHPASTHGNSSVPSARTLGRFLREAQTAVRQRGQVSVLLTTDAKIRALNRKFRGKNKATDVLSFPAPEALAGEVAGDLAISVPTALRQAREQGHGLGVEIKVLMLHGLLHLAGFDHERDSGEMARRERRLRARLGLPQGLIERSSGREKVSRVRTADPSTTRVTKGATRFAQDHKQKQVLPLPLRAAQGQRQDDKPSGVRRGGRRA